MVLRPAPEMAYKWVRRFFSFATPLYPCSVHFINFPNLGPTCAIRLLCYSSPFLFSFVTVVDMIGYLLRDWRWSYSSMHIPSFFAIYQAAFHCLWWHLTHLGICDYEPLHSSLFLLPLYFLSRYLIFYSREFPNGHRVITKHKSFLSLQNLLDSLLKMCLYSIPFTVLLSCLSWVSFLVVSCFGSSQWLLYVAALGDETLVKERFLSGNGLWIEEVADLQIYCPSSVSVFFTLILGGF